MDILDYPLEILAQIKAKQFKNNIQMRGILYKKMSSLLKQNISVKDIIDALMNVEAKKPKASRTPVYYFLVHAKKTIDKGDSFSKSLKGWVSDNEYSLIAAGDKSGDLSKSFEMAVDLTEKIQDAKKQIMAAAAYPVTILLVAILVLYGFSIQLLPVLESIVPVEQWPSSSQDLYYLANFVNQNILYIFIGLGVGAVVIAKSMSLWTGKIRDKVDNYPPYSSYKDFQSAIFLISLSTLLKAGISLRESIALMHDQGNKYVKSHLSQALKNLEKGVSGGKALNIPFMGSGGDDVEIYGMASDFDEAMEELGNQFIKKQINKIVAIMVIFKYVTMFGMAGIILWIFLAFFDITGALNS